STGQALSRVIQENRLRYQAHLVMKLGIVGLPNVGKSTLFNSLYFICIHFSDAKIVILISCIGNFSKKLPIVYQSLTVIEKKQGFFPAFFGSGNAMHRVPTVSPPYGAHPLQRPLQWPAVNFQFIDIQLLSGA
ncbi:MAG: 50S ribosome-binding GTPase, partial [Bacteroidales bacterium]|nr:50S ribosome-binding GTPase [Bacteroidales bacterium]